MKAGNIVLIVIFGFILLSGILFLIYYQSIMWKIYHYPRDNPYNYVKKMKRKRKTSKKKRIVFIGDSLTHGILSVNYIEMLTKKLGKNYDYINAGMNAELSYNVLLRIESIIACKPDFLTILIGTNDANAEIKNVPDKKMLEKLNLPGKPNKKWYIENLEKIITELKEKTDAKIALCSIPIMGEEFSSTAFKQSIDYSKAIFEIANKHDINYLPVNEKMIEYLKQHPSTPKYPHEKRLVEEASLKHFLFRKSFDKLSEEYGFSLLVDHIHINTEGAKIVADLMLDFILSK
ncbi:MAG: SGNH/GDSL hydrolase family protein [Candidatus Heimdallarchaeota archaeon]